MNKETMKRAVVIGIASVVALGAVTTASAAPVLSSTTAVNNAAPTSVIDVRYYRGRHYRHYYGPGVALGALAAAENIMGKATTAVVLTTAAARTTAVAPTTDISDTGKSQLGVD